MSEYIEREAVVAKITELINESGKYTDYECGADDACYIVNHIPAADVRPVVEVEEAVDEAILILNAINASGRMDYGDYSKLHDAICTISKNCGADMREER